MKDLWKIKEALLQFLEMSEETREALLMDTMYRVKVTKRKRTNRRRAAQLEVQRRQARSKIHKDFSALMDAYGKLVFDGKKPIKNKGGYLNYVIKGKTYGIHRLEWMKANGRFIPKGMEVHHKNHKRDDNRIENLELRDEVSHRRAHQWQD